MSEPNDSIGDRLKRLRGDRGFTQEELSAVSGISTRLISALESNARTSARLSTISKLANALDVEVGELVDRRDHLKNDRDGGSVLAVRDALLNPRLLPGIDDADDGEPTPLEQLNKQVDEAWSKYWSGRFGELLALLPGLIGEARVTHAGLGSTAVQPLALTYDLAASLMTQIGRNDLGAIAAERAITTAYGGDDQLLWAILHGRYSWVMFHQGRYMEGESLAAEMAQRIDPSFSDSDREISVWGTLLTYAIAPAAAQEHDPDEYLSLAGAGAARLRQPVQVYNSRPFSSAMVHMQATYAYSTLKKPGEALKAAKHIRPTTPNQPGDLAGISRGAHLMDVAQAHLDAGHKNAAVRKLLEAREVSEVWFRHQRVARAAVTEIRERERRLSPEVKSLARSLDL